MSDFSRFIMQDSGATNWMKRVLEEQQRVAMEHDRRLRAAVAAAQAAEAERLRAEEARNSFLRAIASALRPVIVQELETMATRIGKIVEGELAKGKVKPADTTPKHVRVAKAKKTARVVKRLKANREAKR